MTKVETAEQTVRDAEQTIRDLIDNMWLQRGGQGLLAWVRVTGAKSTPRGAWTGPRSRDG